MRAISKKVKSSAGSVTVEASIVLPVFICVVFSIAFLMRVVQTHEIVQHSLNETAAELSALSYVYHAAGLDEVHNTLREDLNARASVFREHAEEILQGFGELTGNNSDTDGGSVSGTVSVVQELISDPGEELKSLAAVLAQGAFEDIKTEVFTPVVKYSIRKYIAAGNNGIQNEALAASTDAVAADQRLKALNVINGLEGLDFSNSSFLEDEKNDIDLVVRYRIAIPLPIRIPPVIEVVQRCAVKAWVGGDTPDYVTGGYPGFEEEQGTDGDEDIWALGNFSRGRKIRAAFGANLPSSFPGISKYSNGNAALIKSMDLTTAYYASISAAEGKILEYVNDIGEYEGQKEPWGREGITINPVDIKSRTLLLVIPRNTFTREMELCLERCRSEALLKGIRLEVVRYGLKKEVPASDGPLVVNDSQ